MTQLIELDASLKPFLELCESSAARSRYVLVFLVTASILMFSGLWNQLSFSWLELQSSVYTQAAEILEIERRIIHIKSGQLACSNLSSSIGRIELSLKTERMSIGEDIEFLEEVVERKQADTCGRFSTSAINSAVSE